jgi:electron transfer flavoprotein beta subunit
VAEKLNLPQITFVEEVVSLRNGLLTVRRAVDDGEETVQSSLPVLLTVLGGTVRPRPPSVKSVTMFKRVVAKGERQGLVSDGLKVKEGPGPPHFEEWDLDALDADPARCGLAGSPTWVRKIESVVLASRELEWMSPDEGGLAHLFQLLRRDHIIE